MQPVGVAPHRRDKALVDGEAFVVESVAVYDVGEKCVGLTCDGGEWSRRAGDVEVSPCGIAADAVG